MNLAGRQGAAMKQSRLREPMPLWVWLALGLILLPAVAYFAGIILIE